VHAELIFLDFSDAMRICQWHPQDVIRKAKFVFAFENSASKDYVTEKYFHSLEVGAIPVVYRTPNIKDFEPAPNSIIATDDYQYVRPSIGRMFHVHRDWYFCFFQGFGVIHNFISRLARSQLDTRHWCFLTCAVQVTGGAGPVLAAPGAQPGRANALPRVA
jgi:hypothetical protein